MIVLKIGGSLFPSPHLVEWLSVVTGNFTQSIVIVPGGGPFADQVRSAAAKWELPNDVAHDMAVLAMQQYGHLMHGLNEQLRLVHSFEELQSVSRSNQETILWKPYHMVVTARDIDKDWQMTSDSIAAWLAIKLKADYLCMVKSARIENYTIKQLVSSEIVDQKFNIYSAKFTGKINFYHATEARKFYDDFADVDRS